jgi:thiamine-phosphate pyrophosphorylase
MVTDYSLYLVADAGYAAGRDLPGLVEAAVEGGVTVVQLRAKSLPRKSAISLGLEISRRLAPSGVPLIVNDLPDVAQACGAAGVHLGQDDIPIPMARSLLGPGATIGVSVNTPEEARRAEREGADYVGAGPAFITSTKLTELMVLGPRGIGNIVRATRLPVVAIGGIDVGNAAEIARAGAGGIAVVSAILGAPDARRAAEELKRAFQISPVSD